jgi:hypothetical protein
MEIGASRRLFASGYLVAFVMGTVTFYDLFMRLRPFRPGDPTWRLGSVGTVSLNLPTILLALMIVALTAGVLRHVRALQAIVVLSILGSIAVLAALPFFALDVLQLRNLVQPDALTTVDLTMGRAVLTLLLTVVALAWMGSGSWRSATGTVQTTTRSTKSSSGRTRVPAELIARSPAAK